MMMTMTSSLIDVPGEPFDFLIMRLGGM